MIRRPAWQGSIHCDYDLQGVCPASVSPACVCIRPGHRSPPARNPILRIAELEAINRLTSHTLRAMAAEVIQKAGKCGPGDIAQELLEIAARIDEIQGRRNSD